MRHITFLLLILLVPNWLFAGEYYLEASHDNPGVGEQLTVTVYVNTAESANVVSGLLSINTTDFKIGKISAGSSVVGYWIEKPSEREEGLISFSGMVAGGFSATEGKLFAVELIPLRAVESVLEMNELLLLAHDGLGTALPVISIPLTIKIDDQIYRDTLEVDEKQDTEAPENFTPEIIQREDWFDGQAVLVFNTTDKGSGVKAYYVKEVSFEFLAPFVSWRLVSSPYVIDDQTLRSYIYIRAEDEVGNSEIVEVVPEDGRSAWPIVILIILLFLVLILVRRKSR